MLAEENAQETWIKVVQNAAHFEARGSVLSWILTMAKNQALNTIKKRGWEESLSEEAAEQVSEQSLDMSEQLENVQDIKKLKEAIAQLPDRQRVALVLWMHEEKSYSELATELDLDVNAVKALLFRAKENLAKSLKEDT